MGICSPTTTYAAIRDKILFTAALIVGRFNDSEMTAPQGFKPLENKDYKDLCALALFLGKGKERKGRAKPVGF